MEKIRYTTTVALTGEGVKDFLQYKEIKKYELDDEGKYVVGVFTGEKKKRTAFGKMRVELSYCNATNNYEVVVFVKQLKRKGRKSTRKVSVTSPDHGAFGTQQFTKRVDIFVQTNADSDNFKEKSR